MVSSKEIPVRDICPSLHLLRLSRTLAEENPGCSPAPSARIISSSGVIPPDMRDLIRVSAWQGG